jgi:hypothetical protein
VRTIKRQLAGIEIRDRVAVLVIMVAAAFPFRFPILGHSVSVFDLALLVLLAPWAVTIRRVGPPRFPLPYLWLGLGMVAIGALSLVWSADPVETFLYLAACTEGVVAFAMMLTFLRDARPGGHKVLVQAWLILLVIPGVLLWCHVPGFLPPSSLDPNSGDYVSFFVRFSHPLIGRSNNLAALLLLLVPPTVAWAFRTRRWLDIVVALVGEVAFMLSISRGAIVALVAGLALYFLLVKRGRRRTLMAMVWSIPAAVLSVAIGSLNPPTRMYVASRFNGDNIAARIDMLEDAWNGDPAGAGSGGSISGFHLPQWLTGVGGGIGRDVHNTFVQQVLSFGPILGILICVALIVTAVWWYRRNWLQLPLTAPLHGIGVVAVLVSFLFESSFEGSLLRPLIWMGWGLLVVGALRPSARTLSWSDLPSRSWVRKPGEPARR